MSRYIAEYIGSQIRNRHTGRRPAIALAPLADMSAPRHFLAGLARGWRCFTGIRLRGARLAGMDMAAVDLSRADLRGAMLTGATLAHAILTRCRMRGALLDRADLQGADLTHADLRGALLAGADMRGANLCGARVAGADMRGANLREAWLDTAVLDELDPAALAGAHMTGAIFSITLAQAERLALLGSATIDTTGRRSHAEAASSASRY